MLRTFLGTVRQGKIELLDSADLVEGTQVLVTLIANDEAVRKLIAQVNIGDQIYIKGQLVNYSEERWNGTYRNTSTIRTDTGMGACEIIYVTEIQIIKSHNQIWNMLHKICYYYMLISLALSCILFFRRC